MKKILVPVDFSDHTLISCSYAIQLAKPDNAEIKLFHTYFDQVIIADTSFPDTLDMSTVYNEELMKDICHHADRNMRELEETIGEMIIKSGIHNISLSSKVVGGELEHELTDLCGQYHPDLVVMGTSGQGNTLQVWGKVSTYIMDHAKVPVITVPAIKHFRGFSNLMFSADLADGNDAILTKLLSMFSHFNSIIHVVHFVGRGKQTDSFIRMKALQLKFGKEESQRKVRFTVIEVEDDNQKAIDHFIGENHIDLIAFQPHKHSLLHMLFTRKINRKNLFDTNIPMIAMPS